MKFILIVLAILGLSQAAVMSKDQLAQLIGKKINTETLRQEIYADASGYFDQVLANLREQMVLLGLNAIPLPDEVLEFEQVVGGINWHGTAALYNGTLTHLDSIHRTGVAEISVDPNGDIIIAAEVGVNKGTLHYEMVAKFMDLGPHCIVDGTLSQVRVLLALRIKSDFTVLMETFNVKNTGLLSVDIKGLGLVLNFLIEIVAGFLGNLIKGIVVFFLEGPIKDIINQIISSILFPPTVFTAVQALQTLVTSSLAIVV